MSEGLLFDVARGSVHDGPGLRTTLFLKGCPLRCRWCHNPESWSSEPAPPRSWRDEEEWRRYEGFRLSANEAAGLVLRDRHFYARSGGGLTLSGGEPTAQPDFCASLLGLLRKKGVGTCMETSGACERAILLALVPYLDLFLFDYKATGPRLHEELTGVDGEAILGNLEALRSAGARIILRCPLVPGVNDQDGHLAQIARLSRELSLDAVEVLPYHDFGRHKYERAGLATPILGTRTPDRDLVRSWLKRLRGAGANARLG